MYISDIIKNLSAFWENYVSILPSYDKEVGAATLAPWTLLGALGDNPWRVAYTQICRRPSDGRYGKNPHRLQKYIQYQVFMKPHADDMRSLFLDSISYLGITHHSHDIRFMEDNWGNPIVGAAGIGWEIWCNGLEIAQFTYFQKILCEDVSVVSCELTYGVERIGLILQDKDFIFDLIYDQHLLYKDIFYSGEEDFSQYYLDDASIDFVQNMFENTRENIRHILKRENILLIPLCEEIIQLSHLFNILDARGAFTSTTRFDTMNLIRDYAKKMCSFTHKHNFFLSK